MNYALLLGLKNWKTVLIAGIMALGMTMALFFSVLQEDQPPEKGFEGGGGGVALVSPLVMRYEPLVRKYAQQYGVEQYVPLLLAKMMQESGGKLPDVMQSSESLGLPMNTIQDPEYSINVGVRYFSGIIKQTKGDVKLSLQSYNFGGGFIPYALARGGYSKANAIAFSNMMAKKMGWERYGDINYPDHVLRYLKQDASPVAVGGGQVFQTVMKEALKYQGMPYSWGGSNPSTSFDCSGLWVWSFAKVGIKLPRTAQLQYNYTERISRDQLKPGDFIFFTGTASHSYISHVGLFVGNGRMYNAASKGIKYADLKGYYDSHIAGYGRLRGVN